MLEAMKKPHTDEMKEVHFIGSAEKISRLISQAKAMGLVDVSDSVPWRKAFPEFAEESAPSIALRGAREKEGLTQKELARLTGIPQSNLSEMENGKRGIGKELASRLGKVLKVNYRILL
jgi:DNA-binding XRE family transcriptional regulator